LTELSENYGPLDILWLDGGWVNGGHHEFLDMDNIAVSVRSTQPDLLIVDRTIGGKYENYVTPERKIPEIPPQKAWESNIPLAKNWGYVPDDTYKSFDEILENLVKIVCLGGNVILGVGPKPDGTLPDEALNLLATLGTWLKKYGQAIYGTRPQNFYNLDNLFDFVRKENYIYGFIKSEQLTKAALTSLSAITNELTYLNDGSTIDLTLQDFEQPVFKDLYTIIKLERKQ
jgi:alpha-L-fucosidase